MDDLEQALADVKSVARSWPTPRSQDHGRRGRHYCPQYRVIQLTTVRETVLAHCETVIRRAVRDAGIRLRTEFGVTPCELVAGNRPLPASTPRTIQSLRCGRRALQGVDDLTRVAGRACTSPFLRTVLRRLLVGLLEDVIAHRPVFVLVDGPVSASACIVSRI